MADSKFVQRIAKIYIDKYRIEGYAVASAYANRILKDEVDPELQNEITAAVSQLLKEGSTDAR